MPTPTPTAKQARRPEELASEELEQVSGGNLTNNENITGLRPKGGLKVGSKPLESETDDE